VTCKACGKTSVVSPEAHILGLIAALLVGTPFIVTFVKHLGVSVTILAALPLFSLVKGQVTKRLARLDPPDSI
jgi:hypothetical protein